MNMGSTGIRISTLEVCEQVHVASAANAAAARTGSDTKTLDVFSSFHRTTVSRP
jgi:hypothetical protein